MCTLYLKRAFTYQPLAKHVLWIDFPVPAVGFGAPSTFLGAKDRHLDRAMLWGAEWCSHKTWKWQYAETAWASEGHLRKRNSTICESSLWVYYYYIPVHLLKMHRASLVAQWLRICLLMQGTRVRALVWEDPTCHGATRPVSHNYWACASGACAPQQERPR